jgi:hypothetical protein
MTSTRNEICNETLTERAMRIEPPGRGAPSGQRRDPPNRHTDPAPQQKPAAAKVDTATK